MDFVSDVSTIGLLVDLIYKFYMNLSSKLLFILTPANSMPKYTYI